MSKPISRPANKTISWTVTDPAEIAASEELSRAYRKTAAGRVGTTPVIDAPLPLLAQFIVELKPEEREEFLRELVARLPEEVRSSFGASLNNPPSPQE